MFIEYPKALYKDGVGSLYDDLPYVVVNSLEEEQEQNAQGWFEIGKASPVVQADESEDKPAKRKYTRRTTEAE